MELHFSLELILEYCQSHAIYKNSCVKMMCPVVLMPWSRFLSFSFLWYLPYLQTCTEHMLIELHLRYLLICNFFISKCHPCVASGLLYKLKFSERVVKMQTLLQKFPFCLQPLYHHLIPSYQITSITCNSLMNGMQ